MLCIYQLNQKSFHSSYEIVRWQDQGLAKWLGMAIGLMQRCYLPFYNLDRLHSSLNTYRPRRTRNCWHENPVSTKTGEDFGPRAAVWFAP